MNNNWLNYLILLYVYQENISKLIFARQPTNLSMGKTHEKSHLVMIGFTI